MKNVSQIPFSFVDLVWIQSSKDQGVQHPIDMKQSMGKYHGEPSIFCLYFHFFFLFLFYCNRETTIKIEKCLRLSRASFTQIFCLQSIQIVTYCRVQHTNLYVQQTRYAECTCIMLRVHTCIYIYIYFEKKEKKKIRTKSGETRTERSVEKKGEREREKMYPSKQLDPGSCPFLVSTIRSFVVPLIDTYSSSQFLRTVFSATSDLILITLLVTLLLLSLYIYFFIY